MYSIWEVKSQSLGLTKSFTLLLIALQAPLKLDFCSEVLCVHASLILIYFGGGFNRSGNFPQKDVFFCCFGKVFFDREDASDRAECWRCLRILRFVPSLQPNTVAVFPKSSMSLLSFILTYIMANWIKYNSRITADSRCTASHD